MSEQAAAKKISPEEFFENIVPKILDATKDRSQRVGATYGIRLFGDGGGEWTIDLSKLSVKRGGAPKYDLYLEMDRKDFQNMMLGRLNVEGAMKDGRIRFDGDLAHLAKLAEILRPAED